MATRRSTRKKAAPKPAARRLTPKPLGARQDGKDTAEKVLTHAIRELDKHGAVNFSLDRVIASSKVSRSSIYHLFGNRAGVIAQAEARAITLDVSDGAHLLRNLVDRVESKEQLASLIEAWLRDAMSPDRVRQRARRVSNLAASDADGELREILKAHLHDVSNVWVETYEISSVVDWSPFPRLTYEPSHLPSRAFTSEASSWTSMTTKRSPPTGPTSLPPCCPGSLGLPAPNPS